MIIKASTSTEMATKAYKKIVIYPSIFILSGDRTVAIGVGKCTSMCAVYQRDRFYHLILN